MHYRIDNISAYTKQEDLVGLSCFFELGTTETKYSISFRLDRTINHCVLPDRNFRRKLMSLYVDNQLAEDFFFAGGRAVTQAIGPKQNGNYLSNVG